MYLAPIDVNLDDTSAVTEYVRQCIETNLQFINEFDMTGTNKFVLDAKGNNPESMFYFGYVLSKNFDFNRGLNRKMLISRFVILNTNESFKSAVKELINTNYLSDINTNFDTDPDMKPTIYVPGVDTELFKFNQVVIEASDLVNDPINSMLAGYLTGVGIPYSVHNSSYPTKPVFLDYLGINNFRNSSEI